MAKEGAAREELDLMERRIIWRNSAQIANAHKDSWNLGDCWSNCLACSYIHGVTCT
jgi:hypothetical protein